MAEGHVVDTFEDYRIHYPGDCGEYKEYGGCEPDSIEAAGGHERDRGESDDDDLDAEAGEDGGVGSALASESAVVDFLGRGNREQVADGEIDGQREKNSSDCGESGCESRRLVDKAGADPDENHFESEDRGVGKIFCQHDGADRHGRGEVDLDAGAFWSKVVVHHVRKNQQSVGRTDGKRHVGRAAEEGTRTSVRSGRREPENKKNEHGHDQREKHWPTARQVSNFFFEDRRHRAGNSGKAPAHANDSAFSGRFRECGRFAEVFSVKLSAQPEMQEPENRGAIDAENSERASGDHIVALGSARDGGGCRAGRQEALNRKDSLRELAQVRVRTAAVTAHQRPNQLKADYEEEKKHAKDFARAALSEPSFHPGEDHAGKQNVHRCEQKQSEYSPRKQTRRCHCDSSRDSQQPKRAEHRGGLEGAIDNSNHSEGRVAEGKAEEIRSVEIFGEGGGNDREQLPEKKYRPEDDSEPFRFAARDHVISASAGRYEAADSASGETERDEDVRDQFKATARRARGDDERLPADAGDGRELLSNARSEGQLSHESS